MPKVYRYKMKSMISKEGDISCPPKSPDLVLTNSVLKGHKVLCMGCSPLHLNQLQTTIFMECLMLQGALMFKTVHIMRKRHERCLNTNRQHLQNE